MELDQFFLTGSWGGGGGGGGGAREIRYTREAPAKSHNVQWHTWMLGGRGTFLEKKKHVRECATDCNCCPWSN